MFAPMVMKALLAQYNLEYAALFDGSTGYLSRTLSTPTDGEKCTLSFWCKLNDLSTAQMLFYAGTSSTNRLQIQYENGNILFYLNIGGSVKMNNTTHTMELRDSGDYYHFVVTFNTSLATPEVTLNVNNSGSNTISNSLSQNGAILINSSIMHTIGRRDHAADTYSSAYNADMYFIDGQVLAPTDFAEEADNGDWVAKAYSGTYGTNGFHLDFSNSGDLGEDSSGNNNDWTENGTITQVVDTPTANLATLSPLDKPSSWVPTLSNGNTTVTGGGGAYSTIAFPATGKWRFEVKQTTGGSDQHMIGLCHSGANAATGGGTYSTYRAGGNKEYYVDGVNTDSGAYGATWNTANDIVRCEYDADAGEMKFYKNGGSSEGTLTTIPDGTVLAYIYTGVSHTCNVNFSDTAWSGTPTTDFLALNETNLPEITEDLADHWATDTWTGTGATHARTSLNFQPDFLWIKERNNTRYHHLTDAVRGSTKVIYSNATNAEATETDGVLSYDSNGFTLGTEVAMNGSGNTFVGWCASLPNIVSSWGSGTITPSGCKTNLTLGMTATTYSGVAGAQTVPHSGDKKPFMVIIKCLTQAAQWTVYHEELGAGYYMALDTTAASAANSVYFNNTEPTDALVSVGATSNATNKAGHDYIMYCFFETDFCRSVNYTGNGSADGAFDNLGISPEFSIMKNATGAAGSWAMRDNVRTPSNPIGDMLYANLNNAEGYNSTMIVDHVSNGIKMRGVNNNTSNYNGTQYIGVAIGRPTQATKAR